MLNALAGAESLEILVLLKDLSEQGLQKLERNVKHAESTANATKFGGFSKASGKLKADAEAAAGHKGGGGLGALAGGFLGLPGPIGIAVVALGGLAALMGATIPVYERVEKQELALATAAKNHGIALEDLNAHVEASIKTGESYAFSAADTREAIIKLTSAGMSLADQMAALPHIMDLAKAKHIDLAEAARLYELALMGNTRGLKDLGIALPKLETKIVDHKKAVELAKVAHEKWKMATAELKKLQSEHAVTTTKLSYAVSRHAVITEHATTSTKGHTASSLQLEKAKLKVKEALDKYHTAQTLANKTSDAAAAKESRLTLLNKDLTGAIGNQKASVSTLEVAQTKLGDKWEAFATRIGPGLQSMLQGLIDILNWLIGALGTVLDLIDRAARGAAVARAALGIGGPANQNSNRNPYRGHAPAPTPTQMGPMGQGHAYGGVAGLRGPEWIWVGERGPERITDAGGSRGGVPPHSHAIYLDGRKVGDALDRRDYWRGGSGSGNRG